MDLHGRKIKGEIVAICMVIFFFTLLHIYVPPEPIFSEEIYKPDIKKIRSTEYFIQGIKNLQLYRFMFAIEDFTRAISEDSKNRVARSFLGRAYYLAGYNRYAIAEWQKFLQFFPDDIFIRNKLNMVYFRTSGIQEDNISYSFLFSFPKDRVFFKRGFDIKLGSNGFIWVLGNESANLSKFDQNGTLTGNFTKGENSFAMPYGLAMDNRLIYISDFKNDRVHILTNSGRAVKDFGKKGRADGSFLGPAGLALSRDGFLYVADSGNHRIQKFNANGQFLQSFGEYGRQAGQLDYPVDLVIHRNTGQEEIYVLEKNNLRLQKFDIYGNSLGTWSDPLLVEPLKLSLVQSRIYIGDHKNNLLYFDPVHESFHTFRTDNLNLPDGGKYISIAADSKKHLYLLDSINNQVRVLAPESYLRNNLDARIINVDTDKFPTIGLTLQVMTAGGDEISFLNKNNFSIYDEGVRIYAINPHSVKYKYQSMRLVILVDDSSEMKAYSKELEWVIKPILDNLYRQDRIKVVHFAGELKSRMNFDWSTRRIQKEVSNWQEQEGKNTGKALYGAISELAPLLYKKGVILLTAGKPNPYSFSQYSEETLADFARLHDVPIHVINFQGNQYQDLPKKTGGKWIKAFDLEKLNQFMDSERNRHRKNYLLSFQTYKKPALKNRYRELKVFFRNQIGEDIAGYINP
jgi:DNA-binding beta-propeller fold protein YncE